MEDLPELLAGDVFFMRKASSFSLHALPPPLTLRGTQTLANVSQVTVEAESVALRDQLDERHRHLYWTHNQGG